MSTDSQQLPTSGLTVKTIYRNDAGLVWNGTTFVIWNSSNYATYLVNCPEQPSSGFYISTTPNAVDLLPAYTVSFVGTTLGVVYGSGGRQQTDLGAGTGNFAVDHNTGGADNLKYIVDGVPVNDADVRAYLKSDWDAHRNGRAYILAQTRTGPVNQGDGSGSVSGRMPRPMYLYRGNTYTIVFSRAGNTQVVTADVTIPA